ncbi:MAG: YmdB family metallophosphoesterase [Treponema sp.]|jgi:metallophosphoesterase (TIGR00282 family)|nr:YmdB family metallophosphoesterase [Treponema sp.]
MAFLQAIMIGDVVGNPGLTVLEEVLPGLIKKHEAAVVVVNGENAADGFGLTETTVARILAAGADVVTSGNHVWEKREFWPILEGDRRILRPANYPPGTPGQGWVRFEKAGMPWLVVNLQGRELMTPLDCPFRTFDGIPASPDKEIILVDFHAESTREKEALAYYLDGRVSLLVGTHTHVQTADERVLPQGTGYITDLGMTGVLASIIGMETRICLDRARNQVLYRMECAQGTGDIQGIVVKIDASTGKTVWIERITTREAGSEPA